MLNILHVLWLAVNCYHTAYCGIYEGVSAQALKNCLRFFALMGRPAACERSRHATAPSRRPHHPGVFPFTRQADVRFHGHPPCSSLASRCTLQRLVQTTIGVPTPVAREAMPTAIGCFSGEEP